MKYWTEVLLVKKKRSPIFHGTDQTREVNKLFIIWLFGHSIFLVAAAILHL